MPALAVTSTTGCDSDQEQAATPTSLPRVAPKAAVFPISIGADQRTFRDAAGALFTMHGEAAWSLAVELTPQELDTYLADRAQKGFNALYVNLIEHRFSGQDPAWLNRAGEAPFTGTLPSGYLDFTRPNEAYWSHVDEVIDRAADRGMLVVAFPAYVGYQFNDAGWAAEMLANGVENCRAYGEFLGRRYADRDNVMWAMGGDWAPYYESTDLRPEVNALAAGLEATAPDHLITAHSHRNRSALDDYDQPWLDVNTAYGRYILSRSDVTVPSELRDTWNESVDMPFFFIEGQYENEYGLDASGVRAQAWWAVLGGAAGQYYGSNPVWAFGHADLFADDTSPSWQQALDFPGAVDMIHLGEFLEERIHTALVPDFDHAVLVGGYGSIEDESWAACAATADKRAIYVYTPQRRALEVDLSVLTGDAAFVSWLDPRTGDTTTLETVTADRVRSFTPPTSGDWVLLVEVAESLQDGPDSKRDVDDPELR